MPLPHRPSPRTPARLQDRATWLVSRAHARSFRLLNAGFEAHGGGLRGYHYRLLAALEEWGPSSQADVGRTTGIDRSDVTAALTELEAQGLVERSVDPANKRRKIVTLTDAGATRLLDLDAVIDGIQREFLAPLTAEQREQFLGLMSLLVEE
ncbi:MarR family winged helix-turn-helix transcriptional regulator [Actinacidiphila rubida]|uniref:Transcriptional regulator, MarR family n=1 Tax=Actinacidiphila rubida TaxID=310780 RepID=A0A1H8RZ04_9ACTN|nr:MarR family transcriptional regulator [Actinacidiphila rubida]SEO71909.1 transcriptional regulator, MarR family [Actinacidiphila rubida]